MGYRDINEKRHLRWVMSSIKKESKERVNGTYHTLPAIPKCDAKAAVLETVKYLKSREVLPFIDDLTDIYFIKGGKKDCLSAYNSSAQVGLIFHPKRHRIYVKCKWLDRAVRLKYAADHERDAETRKVLQERLDGLLEAWRFQMGHEMGHFDYCCDRIGIGPTASYKSYMDETYADLYSLGKVFGGNTERCVKALEWLNARGSEKTHKNDGKHPSYDNRIRSVNCVLDEELMQTIKGYTDERAENLFYLRYMYSRSIDKTYAKVKGQFSDTKLWKTGSKAETKDTSQIDGSKNAMVEHNEKIRNRHFEKIISKMKEADKAEHKECSRTDGNRKK